MIPALVPFDVAPEDGIRSYANYWNQSLGNSGYLRNKPQQLYTNFTLKAENDKYSFGYTPGTTTINGLTVNQRQALTDALKPKADD